MGHNLRGTLVEGRLRSNLFQVPSSRSPNTFKGKEVFEIEPEAIVILERYPFPGNVRDLQNVIERAMLFFKGTTLTASDLPWSSSLSTDGGQVLPIGISKTV